MSIASGYLHDKHVSLDLLIRAFSLKWQKRWSQIAEGLSGGYLISLNVSGILALPIVAKGHTDALLLPMTIPYFAIPVACLLMLIHWVRRNSLTSSAAQLIVKVGMSLAFFAAVYLPLGYYIEITGNCRLVLVTAALFGPMLLGVPIAFCLGLMATFYVAVVRYPLL